MKEIHITSSPTESACRHVVGIDLREAECGGQKKVLSMSHRYV